MGIETDLGAVIRKVRIRRELTLVEVAARANISPAAVRSLEHGRGSTLSTFIKVLAVLGEQGMLDAWIAAQGAFSPLEALRESRGRKQAPQRAPRKPRRVQPQEI
ncbi:MAG: helix-turn-helix domain-containing protein [Acidobacteriota bacterium]|nr:helix-turn-helix domain-containing protein [Acidobacteriota bacterium]